MAIWSIVAAPLIMGNDMRNVSQASKAILTNAAAIAIDQDPLGQQGLRLANYSSTSPQQVWYRILADGSVAVGLYNKMGMPAPPIPGPPCDTWTHTTDGYYEACGGTSGNVGQFSGLTPQQAQAACCSNEQCAGLSFGLDGPGKSTGSGYYKGNAQCGFYKTPGYDGWFKPNQVPSSNGTAADITINFSDVNLFGSVEIMDVWAQSSLGIFKGSYTAKGVELHDTAFLRLIPRG
jgi:hypothetical protein